MNYVGIDIHRHYNVLVFLWGGNSSSPGDGSILLQHESYLLWDGSCLVEQGSF
jgi:hypothetical protein